MTDKPKYQVLPWTPTPEEEKIFQATDQTFQWLCRLTAEDVRPYAGKWVAAKDCRFIASGETYAELIENLGDTDLQTVVIEHI